MFRFDFLSFSVATSVLDPPKKVAIFQSKGSKGFLVKVASLSNGGDGIPATRRSLLPAAVFGMPTSQTLTLG